jgi:hypothetical protein
MLRTEKENKILQFLESIKQYSEPIKIKKGITICNPSLYASLHIERIKKGVTQTIYNNSLSEVSILKRFLDEQEAK